MTGVQTCALPIYGPNLNRLGTRETAIYGALDLSSLNSALMNEAQNLNFQLQILQSNSESFLIDAIHQALDENIDFIIVNAGAYTHTSIALRDAFLAVAIPFIEVHLSNIFSRETFRHHSYLSDIATGMICGFGAQSYFLALQAISEIFRK